MLSRPTLRIPWRVLLGAALLIPLPGLLAPSAVHASNCTNAYLPPSDVPLPSGYGFGSDSAIVQSFNYARNLEGCPSMGVPGNATTTENLPSNYDTSLPAMQMYDLFNLEREARGLSDLTLDRTLLSQIDLNHAREMVQYNYFAHSSPINEPTPPASSLDGRPVSERDIINPAIGDGSSADPYHWSYLGEDIAANVNAAAAVFDYMYQDSGSSWGHRGNILGYSYPTSNAAGFQTNANYVGVGSVQATSGTYAGDIYFSSDFMAGNGYAPPTTIDATPPTLSPPTVAGTVVTATNVVDTGASSGVAGLTTVAFYVGSIAATTPGDALTSFNTVVGTETAPGVWTATLPSTPASGSVIHAVAVDGSGNYTDCPSTATSPCGSSPTLTRVTHLRVRRLTSKTTVSWTLRDPSGIVGFNVFAGRTRLSTHLILGHRSATYRFTISRLVTAPITLHLYLTNGQQERVPVS